MNKAQIQVVVDAQEDLTLKAIGQKIIQNERISFEDGVALFEKASLPFVGALANWKRTELHGDHTYFNRNFHINAC